MTSFDYLCQSAANADEPYETTDDPERDNSQEGWLKLLRYLHNRGISLPNASTSQELRAAYLSYAGLVVLKKKQSAVDEARKRKGLKRVSLQDLEESDAFDPSSEQGYRAVELRDELVRRLRSVDRAVLLRFAQAWALQEQGLPIPRNLSAAISRDRVQTGLALELKQGRS